MKGTSTVFFMLLLCLSLFAFSPANLADGENYNDMSNEEIYNNIETEVSSFDQFETSVYLPDKGTYNKRVRYWTLTKSDQSAFQSSIKKAIDRN
jgi:hypothetical protein